MKFVRRQPTPEKKKTSNWKQDKGFEETSIQYLNEKTNIFTDIKCKEIVKDKPRQIKGIDLICSIPMNFHQKSLQCKQKVDVKSICGIIPTFSFEISGNVSTNQVGWLVNENYETTYYLLTYHTLADSVSTGSYAKDKNVMTLDNVKYTKAILINKTKMINYILKTMSIDYQDIQKMIKYVRKMSEGYSQITRFVYENGKMRYKRKGETANVIVTCSKQLKEEPVNIIVKRQILEELADKIWEVHDNVS